MCYNNPHKECEYEYTSPCANINGRNTQLISNFKYVRKKLIDFGYVEYTPSAKFRCSHAFVKEYPNNVTTISFNVHKDQIVHVCIGKEKYSESLNKWVMLSNNFYFRDTSNYGYDNITFSNYMLEIPEEFYASGFFSNIIAKKHPSLSKLLQKNNYIYNDREGYVYKRFLVSFYGKILHGEIKILFRYAGGMGCYCAFSPYSYYKDIDTFGNIFFTDETIANDELAIAFILCYDRFDLSKIIKPDLFYKKAISNIRTALTTKVQEKW